MNKITLTEALKEIKTLESRIEKATNQQFIGCAKQNDVVVFPRTNKTKSELETDISSSFQSVTDLIERRAKLKSALMVQNNTVLVTINKETMTIASAIEKKNSIGIQERLVHVLKQQFANALNEVQKAESAIQIRFDETVSNISGKDANLNTKDFDIVREQYEKQLKLTLVNPLDLEKKIVEMEESIENFLSEVDTALSIANATNYVEI